MLIEKHKEFENSGARVAWKEQGVTRGERRGYAV